MGRDPKPNHSAVFSSKLRRAEHTRCLTVIILILWRKLSCLCVCVCVCVNINSVYAPYFTHFVIFRVVFKLYVNGMK